MPVGKRKFVWRDGTHFDPDTWEWTGSIASEEPNNFDFRRLSSSPQTGTEDCISECCNAAGVCAITGATKK